MILSVENTLADSALYSYISNTASASGTVIPIKNINSFSASHAIQVGKTGEEQTEIVVLASGAPSGTALNSVGTLRYSHLTDTPVFDINYNQIIFKRSTSGTSGTATALTGGTISITPDSLVTEFEDTSGISTYAYKTQYYNSVTGAQSSESDWFVPGGPTFYSLQNMRQRVKNNLFSADYIKSDAVIDDWINEWIEVMMNEAIKTNQDYSLGTTSVAFGTAGYGTITVTDFKQPRKVEVCYDGVNYVQSRQIPINQFSDSDIFTAVYPTHYWNGDNTFGIRPSKSGGTARITYAKLPQRLTNDADELTYTLRAYTTGCINYCLFKAYYNDQKIEYATSHQSLFNESKANFIAQITPRDQTGPKTIQFDDTLSGRADDFDLEYYTW